MLQHIRLHVQSDRTQVVMQCVYRFEVQYRYYADTDTLSVYFAKASPGIIATTEDVAPGVLVDYTSQQQKVSIDLRNVSRRSASHFYESLEEIDGKPHLALAWDYNMALDQLAVYLHPNPNIVKHVETEDINIFQGVNGAGLWEAIFFSNASKIVCHSAA